MQILNTAREILLFTHPTGTKGQFIATQLDSTRPRVELCRYKRALSLLSVRFLVTDISATMAPIGVKCCTMVHVSLMCLLPFWGRCRQASRWSNGLSLISWQSICPPTTCNHASSQRIERGTQLKPRCCASCQRCLLTYLLTYLLTRRSGNPKFAHRLYGILFC